MILAYILMMANYGIKLKFTNLLGVFNNSIILLTICLCSSYPAPSYSSTFEAKCFELFKPINNLSSQTRFLLSNPPTKIDTLDIEQIVQLQPRVYKIELYRKPTIILRVDSKNSADDIDFEKISSDFLNEIKPMSAPKYRLLEAKEKKALVRYMNNHGINYSESDKFSVSHFIPNQDKPIAERRLANAELFITALETGSSFSPRELKIFKDQGLFPLINQAFQLYHQHSKLTLYHNLENEISESLESMKTLFSKKARYTITYEFLRLFFSAELIQNLAEQYVLRVILGDFDFHSGNWLYTLENNSDAAISIDLANSTHQRQFPGAYLEIQNPLSFIDVNFYYLVLSPNFVERIQNLDLRKLNSLKGKTAASYIRYMEIRRKYLIDQIRLARSQ